MENVLSIWVSMAESIVTILALIGGTLIAWLGLSTWRQQMVAKADYDLAKRVLIAVYRARDAMRASRLDNHMAKIRDRESMKARQGELIGKANDAMTALSAERLEAIAIWGSAAEGFLRPLSMLFSELDSAYFVFYTFQHQGSEEERAGLWKTLFRDIDIREDEFDHRLSEAVTVVEDALRPRLMLRHKKSSSSQ